MAAHLRYHISLDEEAPVTCESLSLSPVSLTFASLEADEALLLLLPGGTPIPHDTPATLYAQAGSGELVQIFTGRVNSPETTTTATGATRQIRIAGGLASFKDFHFTRTYSTSKSPITALYRTDDDYIQHVKKAVLEVAQLMQSHVSALPGWTFAVSSGDISLGTIPLAPEASMETAPNTCQEWLVKILRPQTDAFSYFDHTASPPRFKVGRFRDVTSQTFSPTTPPLIASRVQRRYDQESSGVMIATDPNPPSEFPDPIHLLIDLAATPEEQDWSDRRNFPLIFSDTPETWSETMVTAIFNTILRNWVEAKLTFTFAGDSTLFSRIRPGAVILLDGVRLNIQTTAADLRNGILSAVAGPPKQLGINDITRLAFWMYKFKRAV